jgi:hypothetical protein
MILLSYSAQTGLSFVAYSVTFVAWWRYLQSRKEATSYPLRFHLLLAATLMWAQILAVSFLIGMISLLDRSLVLVLNSGCTWFLRGLTRERGRRESGLIAACSTRASARCSRGGRVSSCCREQLESVGSH